MSWSLGADGVVRSGLLASVAGVAHGFSSRPEGADRPTDFGGADDESEAIVESRRAFVAACGLGARRPHLLHQVHGDRVVEIDGAASPQADAWFARRGRDAGEVVGVRVADCVPLLIADRGARALAAVHSGWRGTAAGIALRAVERFAEAGIEASELVAALGPAISGERYEVGEEVVRGLGEGRWVRREAGRCRVDLRQAVAAQLIGAGLEPRAVAIAPWCTFGDADEFHSYRRQGAAAGRMIACIGWSP